MVSRPGTPLISISSLYVPALLFTIWYHMPAGVVATYCFFVALFTSFLLACMLCLKGSFSGSMYTCAKPLKVLSQTGPLKADTPVPDPSLTGCARGTPIAGTGKPQILNLPLILQELGAGCVSSGWLSATHFLGVGLCFLIVLYCVH